jgi:hypothetical protein
LREQTKRILSFASKNEGETYRGREWEIMGERILKCFVALETQCGIVWSKKLF